MTDHTSEAQTTIRNFLRDVALLVFGAYCVTVALDFGLGIDFGWWGLLFWAGIGLIAAWIRDRRP